MDSRLPSKPPHQPYHYNLSSPYPNRDLYPSIPYTPSPSSHTPYPISAFRLDPSPSPSPFPSPIQLNSHYPPHVSYYSYSSNHRHFSTHLSTSTPPYYPQH
ncbi:hypothetical protein HanXRQr2_Chr06g0241671 [Helianthus annuus]|uniref:Uncharacterized protein n=1 Tax=Helianthus annuus TaxID=4232 RepID=A0A9K3IPY1_HELAN|nr:hypothetical protein HanXRQr2_Chr06g0241671 [Helianthus annuus]KAJ0559261.1 hypothetical protein HanHA300_Chr06g0198381 [Helianthus annuus]KAJ0572197.1 hypothetical protein HanHA89_Chr06g0213131 [Helianthus annuus]KAJ0736659.1 hypothetical protein HanLR1_Chr06g0198381 [Helianthus annuus]KAJ0913962.1 hypothetical protein HanPSC8_Chr06g0233251 [Helianthus annuus]